MTSYIDLPGLSPRATDEYIAALGLPADAVALRSEHDRMYVVNRLVEGAGVSIFTGPKGANWWLPVSLEVNVRLSPDGTDMDERMPIGMEWALRATGCTPTVAATLAARTSAPTRGQHVEPWGRAIELLQNISADYYTALRTSPIVFEEFPVLIIERLADQVAFLDSINERVCVDGEWEIGDSSVGHGLAVSNATQNWYLPLRASDYTPEPGADEALRHAFMRLVHRVPTIFHNAKADLKAFYLGDPLLAYGCLIDDTIVQAYLLGETDLKLKPLVRSYLGRDPMDYPKGHEGGLSTLPLKLGARYAAAGDTRNTWDLEEVFAAKLKETGRQWTIYESIERPLVPMIASMEWGGTSLNIDEARQLHENFWYMHEGIRRMWWARTHIDIETDLGQRALVKHMTGYDPGSVKQDVLAKHEDEWMDSLLAYRRIRHRDRSFLVKHIERYEAAALKGEAENYRIYSAFNQAGSQDQHDARKFKSAPRSGRLSSSAAKKGDSGNLTNQPGDIRSMFTAPVGMKFWSLDYSGLELNIMASLSQDPNMMRILGTICMTPDDEGDCPHDPKCGDLHDGFRHDILVRTAINVDRRFAKQANFSGAYGGHADMLITILNKQRAFLDYETAKLIADIRRETFPLSYMYGEAVVATARSNGGYSETYYGRRRVDLDLFAPDKQTQGHAERALVNHTVQGTAADVLKIAMLQSVPILFKYGAHLALQVHDEICGWVPEGVADAFVAELKAMMESIVLPGVTLRAEGGVGDTWDDVH
jgi:DNA polymerase I-like protein with 3'-5' exonuclease and polymerase domains